MKRHWAPRLLVRSLFVQGAFNYRSLVGGGFAWLLLPVLRKAYRLLGGIVVFLGSGVSYYFAAYTGDQGGIAAYFFQMAVIAAYVVLSVSIVAVNWVLALREYQ